MRQFFIRSGLSFSAQSSGDLLFEKIDFFSNHSTIGFYFGRTAIELNPLGGRRDLGQVTEGFSWYHFRPDPHLYEPQVI
jgi:hypothetical protein